MKLTNQERNAINEIESIMALQYWRTAANRLYYACYYAASALLIKYGHSAQTHSGVVAMISMYFIKTNIIPQEQGKLYRRLFELRQTGDYNDIANVYPEDIEPLIAPAREFIAAVTQLIND